MVWLVLIPATMALATMSGSIKTAIAIPQRPLRRIQKLANRNDDGTLHIDGAAQVQPFTSPKQVPKANGSTR